MKKTTCKKTTIQSTSKTSLWLGIGGISIYLILSFTVGFRSFDNWNSLASVMFGVFFLIEGCIALLIYLFSFFYNYGKCESKKKI